MGYALQKISHSRYDSDTKTAGDRGGNAKQTIMRHPTLLIASKKTNQSFRCVWDCFLDIVTCQHLIPCQRVKLV